MSIQLLKKNRDIDEDMDSYKKNIRRHRLRNAGIVTGAFLILLFCAAGIRLHMENKTYQTYQVVKSFERADTMMTQYTEFLDYVLKYGKGGMQGFCGAGRREWYTGHDL